MGRARVTLGNFLFAVIAIPLTPGTGWREARYKNITPNRVVLGESGLRIEVRDSSSPLFYPLGGTRRVRAVSVGGQVSGLPKLPPGTDEGGARGDDYALRVGLVIEGETGVGWLEKLFAPEWLRRLVELVPKDAKLGKVAFLTLSQRTAPGTTRPHPSSRYVEEEVAARLDQPGSFTMRHAYPEPVRAFGLWLHADGDDTHSSFDVTLKKLELTVDDEPREIGTREKK